MLGINTYEDKDLRIFFAEKQQQSEKAAKWTDQSLKRLGDSSKSILFKSGLTDKGKTERQIFRLNLYLETETWMKDNGLTLLWKALEGVA